MNNTREDIILNYLIGVLSKDEARAFENELEVDKEMNRLYEEYRELYTLTGQVTYEISEVDNSWNAFQNKITQPQKAFRISWIKVAASILLLAVLTFGMWFFGSTDISLTSGKVVTQEVLTDGSTIILNSNSHIFSEKFNKNHRELSLDGEAKFKVTKGENNFVVHTCNGDIEVYGTEFNVFTDSKSNFTLIELYEGSIGFSFKDEVKILKPGQRLILSDDVLAISLFKAPVVWLDMISCQDAPLSYVLGQIKLSYNVQFNISSRLLKERYTLNLPKDDLAACLSILNQVSGKNFALIGNTIVVK
ncbi:MAG: FecR domain-containing protein [Bacteroidetes bacterium]|jgi:transmembrane sensor|nr:FecR domain-containing protein [Bacteroidota bacterium]